MFFADILIAFNANVTATFNICGFCLLLISVRHFQMVSISVCHRVPFLAHDRALQALQMLR